MGSANFNFGEFLEKFIDDRLEGLSSTFSSFDNNSLADTFRIFFDMFLKIVGAVLVFHN